MSSQNQIKDDYVHIRINSDFKASLKEMAKGRDQTLSEFILECVMTNKNVMTFDKEEENHEKNNSNLRILTEGVREFNKLMKYNQGQLRAPDDIDGNKITKAVKKSWEIII